MKLFDRILTLFRKKEPEQGAEQPAAEKKAGPRPQKACRGCGKLFSYDPSREYVPNFCRECRQKYAKEKEEKQRAGGPRRIRRKCRSCGKFFTFPNTLAHFPNYCNDCRKRHQAEMKARYGQKAAGKERTSGEG